MVLLGVKPYGSSHVLLSMAVADSWCGMKVVLFRVDGIITVRFLSHRFWLSLLCIIRMFLRCV